MCTNLNGKRKDLQDYNVNKYICVYVCVIKIKKSSNGGRSGNDRLQTNKKQCAESDVWADNHSTKTFEKKKQTKTMVHGFGVAFGKCMKPIQPHRL